MKRFDTMSLRGIGTRKTVIPIDIGKTEIESRCSEIAMTGLKIILSLRMKVKNNKARPTLPNLNPASIALKSKAIPIITIPDMISPLMNLSMKYFCLYFFNLFFISC